jgi:hypothetical protein
MLSIRTSKYKLGLSMKIIRNRLRAQPLNARGIVHSIVPVLAVLLIGIGGTFAMVSSNADSANRRVATGKVSIRMYEQTAASTCLAPPSKTIKQSKDLYATWKKLCRVTKAKHVPVYVQTRSSEQGCRSKNGTKLSFAKDGGVLHLGQATTVTCTPGTYTFTLLRGKEIRSENNPNGISAANNLEVTVRGKSQQVIQLGTERK